MVKKLAPVLLGLLVAAGCGGSSESDSGGSSGSGGSGGTAGTGPITGLSDLAGTYELTSVTDVDDEGVTRTFNRTESTIDMNGTSVTAMLRGHSEVLASGDNTGRMDIFMGLVVDGMLQDYDAPELGVEIDVEGKKLLLDAENDGVTAYAYSRSGTVLTLTQDPNDPRTTLVDGPSEVVFTRLDVKSNDLAGTWNVKSLTMAGSNAEFTATSECTDVAGEYLRVTGTATYDDVGTMNTAISFARYTQADCSGAPAGQENTATMGFYDIDVSARTLDTYTKVTSDTDQTGIGIDYSYSIDGTTLTLEVTDFRDPNPSSDDTRPAKIVLER